MIVLNLHFFTNIRINLCNKWIINLILSSKLPNFIPTTENIENRFSITESFRQPRPEFSYLSGNNKFRAEFQQLSPTRRVDVPQTKTWFGGSAGCKFVLNVLKLKVIVNRAHLTNAAQTNFIEGKTFE